MASEDLDDSFHVSRDIYYQKSCEELAATIINAVLPTTVELAFKSLRQRAELGEVEAFLALGKCYYQSKRSSFHRDYNKSYSWLYKAELADHPTLSVISKQEITALCSTLFGQDSQPLNPAAFSPSKPLLMEAAFSQNLPKAQVILAQTYLPALCTSQIHASRAHKAQEAQETQVTQETPGDIKMALKLLSMAAGKGSSEGQRLLGLCHCMGKGVEQDPEKGMELLTKATLGGNEEAVRDVKGRIGVLSAPYLYRWKLEKVSEFLEGEVHSEPFYAFDTEWVLQMYPSGSNNGSSHLSLFLQLYNPKSLNADWKLLVNFSLSLVNRKDAKKTKRMEGFATFSKFHGWFGFKNHTNVEDVQKPEGGFHIDDNMIVEAEIRIEKLFKRRRGSSEEGDEEYEVSVEDNLVNFSYFESEEEEEVENDAIGEET